MSGIMAGKLRDWAAKSPVFQRNTMIWQFGLAGVLLFAMLLPAAAQPMGPAPVAVSTVVQREVSASQTFVATVNPLHRSLVGSAVDGRVVEFLVDDGDRVTENQVLAKLRTETLQIELAGSRAELELRQQELAELQNGSRPEEIEQAKARMASAEAQLEYSRSRFDRIQILHQSGQVVSREEFDLARSNLALAEQSLIEVKKAHELVVAGPRQEKIAQAQATLDVQAEIVKQIQDRIEKHTIRAPFAGFVVAEHTERGAWVKQGDAIVEVIDVDPVEIEVYVPENNIRFIKVGMACQVSLDALPDQLYMGMVARVVPQANVRSRTFPVKIRVENPEEGEQFIIKPGMLARVSLPIGPPQEALLVPKDALRLEQDRPPRIYVVRQGQARPVVVQYGVAEGGLIQVQGDVKAGDQVVVRGNERLALDRPGPVQVQQVLPPEVAQGT